MDNSNARLLKDRIAGQLMAVLTISSLLLVVAMAIGLYLKSAPILSEHSLWELLSAGEWKPMKGQFGFFPFLMGTLYVSLLALAIAIPISLLMAVYLTEYAHSSIKKYVFPLLDILAGLPSVIYGVWGTLVIVPWVADVVAPSLNRNSSGYTVLACGIVLGVTVIPLLVSLFIEIFNNVGRDFREAAWALGATRWQTIRDVILRKTAPGVIAAIVLAASRTLGETIAVIMVCGNLAIVPGSLLDACYPIPALIANNYGEMLSLPLYESALMFAAFILFFVVLVFNLFSRLVLKRMENK
ncbi:MAG: phosphate ABC transporter permease subunit PstC [Bacteroidaceae bacterium]|nr:phosphate ABC transporter permease subunit PstC [Bacteroidaceae bacterium]